jgi:metaxin
LRGAAKAELLKQLAVVDVNNLYHECDKAWSALSHLLGDNQYFFAADRPGLFDASVFAYTNPLLDDGLAWQETRMVKGLRMCEKLVQHRERILKNYFERASV